MVWWMCGMRSEPPLDLAETGQLDTGGCLIDPVSIIALGIGHHPIADRPVQHLGRLDRRLAVATTHLETRRAATPGEGTGIDAAGLNSPHGHARGCDATTPNTAAQRTTTTTAATTAITHHTTTTPPTPTTPPPTTPTPMPTTAPQQPHQQCRESSHHDQPMAIKVTVLIGFSMLHDGHRQLSAHSIVQLCTPLPSSADRTAARTAASSAAGPSLHRTMAAIALRSRLCIHGTRNELRGRIVK